MSKLGLVIAVLMTAGCPGPGATRCPVGETRCTGEVAQICDPKGRWQTLLDCGRVSDLSSQPLVCGPVVVQDDEVGRLEGHACTRPGAGADAGVDAEGGAR
jgi:hypothetical protein